MNKIDFSFFIDNSTFKKLTFFTMSDMAMLFIWLILIVGLGVYVRSQNQEKIHYKYFMRNLYFKLFFSLVCAIYYVVIVRGGDTVAYWDAARTMNKLFWVNPENYLNNMWYDYYDTGFINRYNILTTGIPPGWIIREEQSFFVAKMTSLLTFLCGDSFLALTVIFATIVSFASWRFYDFIVSIFPNPHFLVTVGLLFVPSLSFWCTGISKDTIVYVSLLTILTRVMKIIYNQSKINALNIILILFHLWIILNLRSVLLITLSIPFMFVLSVRYTNRFKESKLFKRIIQVIIAFISVSLFLVGMQTVGKDMNVDAYIQEAAVVQQDFARNSTYTGAKYEIEVPEYSPAGLLVAFPSSVIAGLYRPFLWEALSVSLLLNGLESMFLLYLTFRFLRHPFDHIKIVRSQEILLWCFFFVLLLGFITGFSSIIFGVLVRLRAPLIPFLVFLLSFPIFQRIEQKKTEENLN